MKKFNSLRFLLSRPIKISFVKLHPDAIKPTKGYLNDAAFDLYTYKKTTVTPKTMKLIEVGIAVNCPSHLCWTVRSRGSMHLHGLWVYTGMGDPDYRGDIGVNLWNTTTKPLIYGPGERIGQIQFMPKLNIKLYEVDELESSPRNAFGWGSTGR